jgi:Domain of unknown function (DUF6894)
MGYELGRKTFMPLYYFTLRTRHETVTNSEGVELPDPEAARSQAIAIAREMVSNCKMPTRRWRLTVRDDYLIPCFEILFAEVDETIANSASPHPHSLENPLKN